MSNTHNLVSELKEIVGETHVIQDPDKLMAYAIDGMRPKAVVFPGGVDEVSKIVAYANQHHLSIAPMGNRTKMGMGGIPKRLDMILSTRRLSRITDCDIDNLTLSVESGITLNEVQKKLAKEGKGYFLPLDPPFADEATLGGIVATNSSGPKRLLYGTARDLIIGIKSVFPDGNRVTSGGKTVKNVSGYDMSKLLIGSFGTLGIICEVTFRLLPLPEKEATLLIPFTQLKGAEGFVHEISHSQLIPASIETLNARAVEKIRYPVPMPPGGNYLVAIGLEGVAESIDRQISEMSERSKKHEAFEPVMLNSEKHYSFWVAIRDFQKDVTETCPDLISLKSTFSLSKWGEVLGSSEKIAKGLAIDCALACHSGNGILSTYLLAGKEVHSKIESFIRLIGELTSEAVKNGGNLVVESCPLPIKEKVDVWGQPRSDYRIVHRLKEEIDPAGVLNPGRFIGGI